MIKATKGLTVHQLTGVCKDIAEGKRDVTFTPTTSESAAVHHHPFAVKEAPAITIKLSVSYM